MSFDMIVQRYTLIPILISFLQIYLFANGNIMQTCGAIRHTLLACPRKKTHAGHNIIEKTALFKYQQC